MLVKAIIIALWSGFCMLDQRGLHLGFRKPLLAGVVVGFILGNPLQGLMIAGSLELMWLGTNAIGAYQPPDVISGAIVGVAIGILSGEGEAAAVAVGITVAMLVQQLDMLVTTLNIFLVHKADEVAENGDFDKITSLHFLGGLNFFLSRAIPVFLCIYFGAPLIENILTVVPAWVLTGLGIASKIIPAVGLAMLLSMMLRKNMWIFFIIGFAFANFMQLSTVAIALFAFAFAGIYGLIIDNQTIPVMHLPQESKEYDL